LPAVQRFDLNPGSTASTNVPTQAVSGAYDVQVHGPNGFLRHASGTALGEQAGVEATLALVGSPDAPTLQMTLTNQSTGPQTLIVRGLHGAPHQFPLARHATQLVGLNPLANNHGWYDLVVSVQGGSAYERRFAGHLENGQPSRTGPD
jgi:phospholipase C